MRDYELTTLYVDYSHLLSRDDVLARAISDQYYRFLPYLRHALLSLVRAFEPTYVYLNATSTASAGLITREFNIAFYHLPLVSNIRELRTERIGTLMSISGTVTRTSEVRPELIYGSFVCAECGGTVNEVEQQFKYTEVRVAPAPCLSSLMLSHSQTSALTLCAATALLGNSPSKAPNSQTGKKSASRRTHQRSPQAPCLAAST